MHLPLLLSLHMKNESKFKLKYHVYVVVAAGVPTLDMVVRCCVVLAQTAVKCFCRYTHTYIPVYHLYCHVNSISFINLVLPTILCPSIPNGHALEHDWRWWGTEQVKKIYSIHPIVVVFVIVAADFFLPLLFTSVLYSIAKTLLLLHLCMRVCAYIGIVVFEKLFRQRTEREIRIVVLSN